MENLTRWLSEREPWIKYRTLIDLQDQPENTPKVMLLKKEMINHPKIQSLLEELKNWPGPVIASHKSANQHFHKLSFIADLGLKKDDPHIKEIIKKIYEHKSKEGPFQIPMNISKHYGGTGSTSWAWALCDAPTIIYSLAKFGLNKDEQIQKATSYLTGLVQDYGWPCTVSKELGKFRGPGRKNDPCPYATLVMLKMLSQFEKWKNSKQAHIGAESLLSLWSKSKERHPYIFYMGTDFRKIKAPYVWYDILHVLDVLSQFSWLRNQPTVREMAEIVSSKADKEGKYTSESVWRAWNGWDFGQKKNPSRWLTFLVLRTLRRLE
jgi:hypothetical protein